MGNYKALFSWHEDSNVLIKNIKYDSRFEGVLNMGISLKGMNNPVAELENLSGKYTDFLFAPTSEHIVSEKVKTFLEKTEGKENFEFYPVEFKAKDTPSYYLMNILGFVDAFDWEKSDYVLFDELGPKGNKVIRNMNRMEIDEKKTQGKRIFLMEDYIGTTYIHKSLADEMKAAGITGFKAQPLIGNA